MASAEALAWLSVAIMLMIVFLFSGAIYFFFYREKPTPTPGSSIAEAITQATETKSYAGTAIKVIATIAIAIIVIWACFAGYNHFFSGDSSSKNSQKTASAENIVTVIAYANGATIITTPFFEKGQTIVITAKGSVTGSTDRNSLLYGSVGPTGWTTDPKNIQGQQKFIQDKPFMALYGTFETTPDNYPYPFYIGREISIKTERSGTEKILFAPNEIKNGDAFKNNGGYFTVTIRVI